MIFCGLKVWFLNSSKFSMFLLSFQKGTIFKRNMRATLFYPSWQKDGQYWSIPDNIKKCIMILGNIGMFLIMWQLRQDRAKIAVSTKITNDIGQYWTILGNSIWYWMILFSIVQYLNVVNDITSHLAIQARLHCF